MSIKIKKMTLLDDSRFLGMRLQNPHGAARSKEVDEEYKSKKYPGEEKRISDDFLGDNNRGQRSDYFAVNRQLSILSTQELIDQVSSQEQEPFPYGTVTFSSGKDKEQTLSVPPLLYKSLEKAYPGLGIFYLAGVVIMPVVAAPVAGAEVPAGALPAASPLGQGNKPSEVKSNEKTGQLEKALPKQPVRGKNKKYEDLSDHDDEGETLQQITLPDFSLFDTEVKLPEESSLTPSFNNDADRHSIMSEASPQQGALHRPSSEEDNLGSASLQAEREHSPNSLQDASVGLDIELDTGISQQHSTTLSTSEAQQSMLDETSSQQGALHRPSSEEDNLGSASLQAEREHSPNSLQDASVGLDIELDTGISQQHSTTLSTSEAQQSMLDETSSQQGALHSSSSEEDNLGSASLQVEVEHSPSSPEDATVGLDIELNRSISQEHSATLSMSKVQQPMMSEVSSQQGALHRPSSEGDNLGSASLQVEVEHSPSSPEDATVGLDIELNRSVSQEHSATLSISEAQQPMMSEVSSQQGALHRPSSEGDNLGSASLQVEVEHSLSSSEATSASVDIDLTAKGEPKKFTVEKRDAEYEDETLIDEEEFPEEKEVKLKEEEKREKRVRNEVRKYKVEKRDAKPIVEDLIEPEEFPEEKEMKVEVQEIRERRNKRDKSEVKQQRKAKQDSQEQSFTISSPQVMQSIVIEEGKQPQRAVITSPESPEIEFGSSRLNYETKVSLGTKTMGSASVRVDHDLKKAAEDFQDLEKLFDKLKNTTDLQERVVVVKEIKQTLSQASHMLQRAEAECLHQQNQAHVSRNARYYEGSSDELTSELKVAPKANKPQSRNAHAQLQQSLFELGLSLSREMQEMQASMEEAAESAQKGHEQPTQHQDDLKSAQQRMQGLLTQLVAVTEDPANELQGLEKTADVFSGVESNIGSALEKVSLAYKAESEETRMSLIKEAMNEVSQIEENLIEIENKFQPEESKVSVKDRIAHYEALSSGSSNQRDQQPKKSAFKDQTATTELSRNRFGLYQSTSKKKESSTKVEPDNSSENSNDSKGPSVK